MPWKGALDLLRRHLRASYVTLMLRPPSAELEPLMVNSAGDWPITREAEYNKHYYALDPFVDLPPDRVFTVNELIGDANWRESEFYKNFLKPLDILHALGADIRTDDGLECRLRVARPHRESPFSDNDKLLCTSSAAASEARGAPAFAARADGLRAPSLCRHCRSHAGRHGDARRDRRCSEE